MKSNIVRVDFKQKQAKPPEGAAAPGRYAKEASEAATEYLQQLEQETGERLGGMGDATEGISYRCPYCQRACAAQVGAGLVFKGRVLRVQTLPGNFEIKCRWCKRWVGLPFRVEPVSA